MHVKQLVLDKCIFNRVVIKGFTSTAVFFWVEICFICILFLLALRWISFIESRAGIFLTLLPNIIILTFIFDRKSLVNNLFIWSCNVIRYSSCHDVRQIPSKFNLRTKSKRISDIVDCFGQSIVFCLVEIQSTDCSVLNIVKVLFMNLGEVESFKIIGDKGCPSSERIMVIVRSWECHHEVFIVFLHIGLELGIIKIIVYLVSHLL